MNGAERCGAGGVWHIRAEHEEFAFDMTTARKSDLRHLMGYDENG